MNLQLGIKSNMRQNILEEPEWHFMNQKIGKHTTSFSNICKLPIEKMFWFYYFDSFSLMVSLIWMGSKLQM